MSVSTIGLKSGNRIIHLKWSRYIPYFPNDPKKHHFPGPKQIAFLALPHREALYGGAANGGKTEALCMDALRWFDTPGFSCVIFRRKLTDHKLKSSCLNRILEWLEPWIKKGDVKWFAGEHTLRSKEGGTITFGYLDKTGSKERYQSSEYHLIIFDELTQFLEEEYLYLFTRLRRTVATMNIPLRMRAGTNPGNRGHAWVRKRFKITLDDDGEYRGKDLTRPFIQAKNKDNKHTDAKTYELNLMELDPVTRERMLNGDWSASEDSVFKDSWFGCRWRREVDYYILESANEVRRFHHKNLFYFTTVDSACSEADGVEKRVFKANQEPSWHDCGVFALTPDCDLLWLDNLRGQWPIPTFVHLIIEKHRLWRPAFARVESNTIGAAVCQMLSSKGIAVQPVPSTTDKLARSYYAQMRAEAGKIWLPDGEREPCPWLPDLEDELFVWTGKKGEVADQIDVLSSAAQFAALKAYGREREDGVAVRQGVGRPVAVGGLGSPRRVVRRSGRTSNVQRPLFQPFR